MAIPASGQADPQDTAPAQNQAPAASEPAPRPQPFRSLVGNDSPLLQPTQHVRGVVRPIVPQARPAVAQNGDRSDISCGGNLLNFEPQLSYFGGPVVSNVQVVPVFWNNNVNSQIVSDIPGFFDRIESNPEYDRLFAEYSTTVKGGTNQFIGQGTAASSGITLNPKLCPATTSSACTILDTDLQAELAADIKSGVLPQPTRDAAGNVNTMYMVYFPANVEVNNVAQGFTTCEGGAAVACGYHSTGGTKSDPLIYGVITDYYTGACANIPGGGGCGTLPGDSTSFQKEEMVSYHELAEAVTDTEVGLMPEFSTYESPAAWADNNGGCGEIADICSSGTLYILKTNGVSDAIQSLWSNQAQNCVVPGDVPTFVVDMAPIAEGGLPALLTLTVQDLSRSPVVTLVNYTGTVHFTSTDPKAKLPADYTFTTSDRGQRQFQVTFETAGSQTVTATDTLNNAITGRTGLVSVSAPVSPGFTSPIPGSALSEFTTFTWTPANKTVKNWRITMSLIGPGGNELTDTGVFAGSVTSKQFFISSGGAPLFVRLWFEVGATWNFVDAEYSEAGQSSAPVINFPAPQSTLAGANQPFAWIAGNGNAQFEFTLGTTVAGSSDVFDSGVIHSTGSVNVAGIPTKGAKLFARLSYEIAGKWNHVDTTYTEANSLPPASATTTIAQGASAIFNPAPQNLGVLASVTSPAGTVTNGWVTFTLFNKTTPIGAPATGDVSSNGTVDIDYPVPGGLPVGTYQIKAVYTPGPGFLGSSDSLHTITVSPDTILVNTIADPAVGDPGSCPQDDAGACSLRDALAAAAEAGQATVAFDQSAFSNSNTTAENTISLSSGKTLTIPPNTTIQGFTGFNPLRNLVTIDGGGGKFGNFPIFTVAAATKGIRINNLTIANGANPSGNGGAIQNSGAVSVFNCTFSNNTALSGGAIANGNGVNSASLTVQGSTFAGNTAGSGGGALMNFPVGTITLEESTIAGNAATIGGTSGKGLGGGIRNQNALFLNNVTITGNAANGGQGGGLFNDGNVNMNLANSIVSGNFDGTLASPGAKDDIFSSSLGNKGGNVVGTFNGTTLTSAALDLSPLGNHFGVTQTILPLPGSVAICAGLHANVLATFDQRGEPVTNNTYAGVKSQPCVDAGSVQTDYALSFSTNPGASQASGVAFPAAVALTESGAPLTAASESIGLSLLPVSSGVSLKGTPASTNTGTGIATYSLTANSSVAQSNLQLQANLALNGGVFVTATSSEFNLSGNPLAPTVTGIKPGSGATAGGTSVTISGTNFTGATSVMFGGTAAKSFAVTNSQSISAVSPPGTGTVDVTVTTGQGTSAKTPADQFTYGTPNVPTVTAVTPSIGPAGGGTPVTIQGTNFTGAVAVLFGANGVSSLTVNSATSISTTSPPGSGTVDVKVITPAATSALSPADRFTYLASQPITMTNLGANQVTLGLTSNVTGTGFFTLLPGINATCGSAAQTAAGENSSGKVVVHGSLPLTANMQGHYTVRNLMAGSAYTACFTPDGATGPFSSSFTTTAQAVYNSPKWVPVGSPDFTAGADDGDSIVFSPDGTPYLAFQDGAHGDAATVVEFNGNAWVNVGAAGFSPGQAKEPHLAFAPDGTLYIAFKDVPNSHAATVMKFNGNSWVSVGNPDFAPLVDFLAFAFAPDGTPYVAFEDQNNGLASAMKLNGSTWVNVGSAGFSPGQADYVSLAFAPNGTPYVAFSDGANSWKATVMEFNGKAWVNVGSPDFSQGQLDGADMSLAIAPDGTPYVAYMDGANNDQVTAMEFNGTTWVTVGSAGFSRIGLSETNSFLAVAPNGEPYVAVEDTNSNASVLAFNGSAWTAVGSTQFKAATSESFAFAPDGTPYLAYGDGTRNFSATVIKLTSTGTATPTITAVNPSVGANTGGTTVTISGTNFTGATAVKFGGTAAENFTVNSSTSIAATSPPGSGTVDVIVTTPIGTSVTSSADHFIYVSPQATQIKTSVTPGSSFVYGKQPAVSFSFLPTNATGIGPANFTATLDNTIALTIKLGTTANSFNIALPAAPLAVGGHTIMVQFPGIAPFYQPSNALILLNATPPPFVVTTAVDDNSGAANCVAGGSSCSLRDALAAAANVGGGSITFSPTVFKTATTLTLTQGALVLPTLTTITGPTTGTGPTRKLLISISGNHASSVLVVNAGAQAATLFNLGIVNGARPSAASGVPGFAITAGGTGYTNPTVTIKDPTGSGATAVALVSNGAISAILVTNPGSGYTNPSLTISDPKGSGAQTIVANGSGIVNFGNLTVLGSAISGNSDHGFGGGIINSGSLVLIQSTASGNSAQAGAGLFNGANSSLTLAQSTISGNTAAAQGGGIFNQGMLTINQSTIANNGFSVATGQGGGIYSSGPVTIFASTISGNSAGSAGQDGGAFAGGKITVSNSIIAGNSAGTSADLSATNFVNNGGNLVGTGASGTSAIKPMLTALGNHGGLNQTMVPIAGSPAICNGLVANIPKGAAVDQRGEPITNINYAGYSQASPCADSGAVQSHYLLNWVTEPPNVTAGSAMSPAPQVQIQEGGSPFSDGTDSFPITLTLSTGAGKITGGTASTSPSTGIATFSALSIDTAGTGDIFTATMTVNSASTPVASLAQNSEFFNVAAPGQATAFIAFGSAAQTIEGFGGSTAWMPQLTSSAADALFSNTGNNELGLSILRVRIDPGGSANWSTELANAQEAQSRGAIVIATPWTPPAAMKSNNSAIGGVLNTAEYSAYAAYLNSFVTFLKNGGVKLYAISLQNEPDANVTYESCGWTGATIDTWVREEGASISTRLFLPESESFNTSYSDPTLNDSSAVGNFAFVAGHLYGTFPKNYTNAFSHNKQVWMTEHYITSTGINGAMQMAKEMINAFSVGNYSAYLWWWAADWPAENYSNGLIDTNNHVTLYGYVMAQWSKFVKTGYQRFNSTYQPTTNVFTNSFAGDGHNAIVVVNTGTVPVSQKFSVSGAAISSYSVFQTSNAVQSLQNVGAVNVSSGNFTYILPAQSVTTFYH